MGPMQTERSHDKLYLSEQRYEQPKEAFKFVVRCLEAETGAPMDGAPVFDVGCAAGEFAYFLRKIWPKTDIVGIDLLPELVEMARKMVPGVAFRQGSVLEPSIIPAGTAAAVFMSGVLSIFDEFEPVVGNLLSWLRPGGTGVIFGLFNSDPVDVVIRSRRAGAARSEPWETGWNVFSEASVGAFLDQHQADFSYRFVPFEIGIDLPKRPEDPLRSWTVPMADGHRMIVNGLCLVHDFKALVVSRRMPATTLGA